jgi:hypothetical protein
LLAGNSSIRARNADWLCPIAQRITEFAQIPRPIDNQQKVFRRGSIVFATLFMRDAGIIRSNRKEASNINAWRSWHGVCSYT